ncbi:hypothetical protein DFH29DRAFT_1007877 [Suillus ampliporus]|nr:hypothetical protein DFH29DRAFT_1007877 [Suillus ampliporus]
MHDRGTKSLCEETHANVKEGKKFVENYLVEHHDVPEDDAQVATTKWYNEVVECRLYYKHNGREFDKLLLQGGMMSWWETRYCPALLGGDNIREKDVVKFFNNTGVALDKMIIEVQGYDMVETLSKDAWEWRDTSTTLVFPLSGANITSRHGSSSRKPNAVLMKQAPHTDTFQWANFISVMEIKSRDSLKLNSDMISYWDIEKYLKIITWFKYTDLELLGYNMSISEKPGGGIEMRWPAAESDAEELAAMIVSVIYNSQSGIGRSTRVMGISYIPPPPPQFATFNSPSQAPDAKIHQLLEDSEYVDKAKLKNDIPDTIEETAHEVKLTKSLYTLWSTSPRWDADVKAVLKGGLDLRGLASARALRSLP